MATSYTPGDSTPFGCVVGDRIELIHMNDPWFPVEPGTTGTVIGFCDSPGLEQVVVKWDNERSLNLAPDFDRFRVIQSHNERNP